MSSSLLIFAQRWLEYFSQEGKASGKNLRAEPPPGVRKNDINVIVWKLLSEGYIMKIEQGIRRITLLRNLIAKSWYDAEGLAPHEIVAVWELYEICLKKSSVDPSFSKKYHQWLITVGKFIRKHFDGKTLPLKLTESAFQPYNNLVPFLPSKQAYFGYKNDPRMREAFKFLVKDSDDLNKKFPPSRYVGVGYRDKGTRSNPSFDGSPHWKEVAGHHGPIKKTEQHDGTSTGEYNQEADASFRRTIEEAEQKLQDLLSQMDGLQGKPKLIIASKVRKIKEALKEFKSVI